MFSPENLNKIEELRKRYPTTQALVLPALWMAQEEFGCISQETMMYIAGLLNVPFGHVLGVVTFYTMFQQEPVGKRHLEVCTNVSCYLRGSAEIVKRLKDRLGIEPGETTPDRMWTLSEVECMGSCGTAPMMAIGEEYFENLTPTKVDEILSSMK
ncbi:MAG: NADH-quinone oxidoreductase subunit NuoE [Ignavibacteria bacterium]|nr:NADH-quinone oxidoreductase subunit NuoE [Ignavibacteria bacterium]